MHAGQCLTHGAPEVDAFGFRHDAFIGQIQQGGQFGCVLERGGIVPRVIQHQLAWQGHRVDALLVALLQVRQT